MTEDYGTKLIAGAGKHAAHATSWCLCILIEYESDDFLF